MVIRLPGIFQVGQRTVTPHWDKTTTSPPFLDFDGDGQYNPALGDAPGYDTSSDQCDVDNSASRLMGDANWFWVFNDAGRVHSNPKEIQSVWKFVRRPGF